MSKKRIEFSFLRAVLVCSLVLSGCFSPWKGDEGSFSITLGGGNARTAVPWAEYTDNDELTHTITLSNGPGPVQTESVTGAQTVSFSVTPGYWDISVEAGLGEVLYAEGSDRVNIKPGPNGAITISMKQAGTTYIITADLINEQTGAWSGGAYGTVTGTGDYYAGYSVTVTAAANPGYTFVKWVSSDSFHGTAVSTLDSYSFTVAEDTALYAVFDGDGITTPINVTEAEEMLLISDNIAGKFALMADLDFNELDSWYPPGMDIDGYAFTGTFDGRGHLINVGTDIVETSGNEPYYAGLFGYIGEGGEVRNLRLTGEITIMPEGTGLYIGAAAGMNWGTIENVSSSVTVGTPELNNGYSYTGGIAGVNETSGQIKNCYSTGSVSALLYEGFAGGIAGRNYGKISFCWASGEIKAEDAAGGIAGSTQSMNPGDAFIQNCAALNGEITGSGATFSTLGRILGTGQDGLSGNYANSAMLFSFLDSGTTGSTAPSGVHNDQNGADLSLAQAASRTWWSAPGWIIHNDGSGGESSPWEWNSAAGRPRLWFE